jgi:glycosyltransferase involved in cell wall biosynthesis
VKPLLTAALIVRDEEAVLEECLTSIGRVADEIIVVDTGSRDSSGEIALRCGARLLHHPWEDNFAEARNMGLDHANGDWVLCIDADERLEDSNRAHMDEILRGSDAAGFRVLLHPLVRASAYLEYRIWRNDPSIRFEGIIHETVVPGIIALAEREGRTIPTTDLVIRHLGYEGDQRAKHLRNLPMLRREVVRNPTNIFVRHHLFRVFAGLGRYDEADAALTAALEAVQDGERRGMVDERGILVYRDVIRRRGDGEDAEELLAHALSLYPDNCALLVLDARRLITQERYDEAIRRADRVLEIVARGEPSVVAYDLRLLGETPHALKALCLFRLERYRESADEYAGAAELAPDEMSYRVKREVAAGRARQMAGQKPNL